MSDKSFPDPDAKIIEESGETIKLVTWNLWWKFESYKERENLILTELKETAADIMCLQEVWEEEDESQAKIIADILGYQYVYGKSFEFDGVAFGNAIISKYPIQNHQVIMFKADPKKDEKKLFIHAELLYKNSITINVICTHLNYKYEHQPVRESQVTELMEYISHLQKSKFPVLLCGDFNADPESDEIKMITGHKKPINETVLRDVWNLTNIGEPGYTWSNENKWAMKTLEYDRRIDYIFSSKAGPKGLGQPVKSCLIGNKSNDIYPSDHFGILTQLVGIKD